VLALGGVVAVHAAPAATWLPGVRRLLPGVAGVGAAGRVALTFDDGPDPASTPRFLDELRRLGCLATFFVLGEMLERHPELGRRAVAEGHEIAVHGWRHDNALVMRPGRAAREIADACALVRAVTGARPAWYRPPYGVLSAETLAAARACGLRPVLWTAPTTPRPPDPGGRRSARCPSWWAAAAPWAFAPGRCATTASYAVTAVLLGDRCRHSSPGPRFPKGVIVPTIPRGTTGRAAPLPAAGTHFCGP
jgi:peptidoglycan/xylan/chitin deacetylase (PgdA/CDA1 family)